MLIIEGGRSCLYQWDVDQRLEVVNSDVLEVHFSNAVIGAALVCEVYEEDGRRFANIPNVLLQQAWAIQAHGCCELRVRDVQVIRVVRREKPADYVYTETEVKRYEDLDKRLRALEENGGGGGGAVQSVNGKTGEVVLTAADVGAFPSTGGKVGGSVNATGTLIAGQGNTYVARLAGASGMAMMSAVDKSGKMVNNIQLSPSRTTLGQPLAVNSGGHGGTTPAEGRKNLEVDSSTEVSDKIAAQVGQITPATIGAIADRDGIIQERHLGAQVVKNASIAYGAVTDSRIAEKTIAFKRLADDCVEDIKAVALPTASADIKGGVKVGDGLQMDGEVLEVQDKVFTHIETFTFGEDMAFERTQEPSGRAYAFDAIALQINKPKDVTIGKAISIGVIFTGGRISQPLYFVPCSKTEDLWMLATVENYKGLARRTRTTDWAIYNSTSAVNEVPFLMFDNALRKGDVIQRILTEQIIPAGVTFELWGVRANA